MAKPFGPHRRLQVESLEDRSLPSGDVSGVSNGILAVIGTDSADAIVVRQTAAHTVAVTANGTNLAARIQKVGANLYTVPLYRPGTGWIRQTVYFDGTWTDNDPMIVNRNDAWVVIYQRAFLQEMGVNWSDANVGGWTS